MKTDLGQLGINVVITTPKTDNEILEDYMDHMFFTEGKNKTRHLNENTFAEAFRDVNRLQYNNGLFYTRSGKTTEEMLSRDIWLSIKNMGVKRDVERITKKLIGAVKLASTIDDLHMDDTLIPFQNGDMWVDERWEFRGDEKIPTPYRLPVALPLRFRKTPYFTKWINDLFTPEDAIVIQEYLGYCLVPTTKAQKSLILVGEGGTGKSVLGVILESILGDAMIATQSTQEFLQDKFKLPELEHKLVLYDDDLDEKALTGTGVYKKLITNTIAITADRKYGQPFKFKPQVKIVTCTNQMLSSLNDNSDGFYRRLLPVVVKALPDDFVPDPLFYERIKKEAPGIAQWALIGLKRLVTNNWVFSESERSTNFLGEHQEIGNHFPDFFESSFITDKEGEVTVTDIVSTYQRWCWANACEAETSRRLQLWLAGNAERLGIERTNNIQQSGARLRGYKGIKLPDTHPRSRPENSNILQLSVKGAYS